MSLPIAIRPTGIDAIFNGCMAGGWALFGGVGLISLLTDAGDLRTASKLEATNLERSQRIAHCAKKVFLDLTFLVGVVANAIEWAHRVEWISIGKLAPIFGAVGLGAVAVGCGVGTLTAIQALGLSQGRIAAAVSEEAKEKESARQRLAFLDVVWNVTTAAWGALGCAAALGLVVANPVVMGGLLVVGSIFCTLSLIYSYHKGLDSAYSFLLNQVEPK